jgi:hypothetical protein
MLVGITDFAHSEFDNLMLQFGLETRITSGTGISKQVKVNELSRISERISHLPTLGLAPPTAQAVFL